MVQGLWVESIKEAALEVESHCRNQKVTVIFEGNFFQLARKSPTTYAIKKNRGAAMRYGLG